MASMADCEPLSTERAPFFHIPDRQVMAVEHPCVVKNVEKAVDMLGGPKAIKDSLSHGTQRTLALNFHPEDRASRTIISFHNQTQNVLLKITLPKRTGRKRKRGSDEPFVEDTFEPTPKKDARYLLRSLADNPSSYSISPVATISSTHLFRSMPDFVYSLSSSNLVNNLRTKVVPNQYSLMKTWTLPRTYGLADTDILPPPVFSTQSLPHNYVYRQNPAVKQVVDPTTGSVILHNTQAPLKIHTIQCQWDTTPYPTAPPSSCPPLHTQPTQLQSLVTTIRQLFTLHPLYTRRSLLNALPPNSPVFLVRSALAYAAFAIRSGPFRDTYCAYGHDPRTSPHYRKYQTILLQLVPSQQLPTTTETAKSRTDFARRWSRSPQSNSHVFTGNGPVPPDGKCWLLNDIQDPELRPLVDIDEIYISKTCSPRYLGWYPNGTLTKIRVVMKAKVDYMLLQAQTQHPDPGEVARSIEQPSLSRILSLPEEWDGTARMGRDGKMLDPLQGYLPRDAGRKELEWAAAWRQICRSEVDEGRGKVKGRKDWGDGEMGEEERGEAPVEVEDLEGEGQNVEVQAYEEPEEGDGDGEGDDLEMGEIERHEVQAEDGVGDDIVIADGKEG